MKCARSVHAERANSWTVTTIDLQTTVIYIQTNEEQNEQNRLIGPLNISIDFNTCFKSFSSDFYIYCHKLKI